MKIGIVSHSFLPQIGGKELYIYNLAVYLTRRGHEVHVLTSNTGLQYKKVNMRGYLVHYLPAIAIKIPGSTVYYRIIPRLALFLKRFNFDIVNLQEYSTFATDIGAICCYLQEIPTVLTIHNPWFIDNALYNIVMKLHQGSLGRIETKLIDRFVVVSKNMYGKFTKAFPHTKPRTQLVYNGVSLDFHKQEPQTTTETGTKKILFLSRISRDKGVEVLVRAFALLRERHNDCQLFIVGPETDFKHEMEKLVDKLKVTGGVFFRGPVLGASKIKLINEMDCMCLPSFNESCPSTILEAMAMKKSIIATKIPGIIELLPNEDYGYLFQLGSPEDLAEKLEQALYEEKKTAKKIEKAFSFVQQFDWEKIARQVEEIFLNVLKEKRLGH